MTSSFFDPRAIGRRIQAARGEMSQRELGAALGYLQPHISRYERGDVPGSYRFLAGLAALFDIDVNWVLTGTAVAEAGAPVSGLVSAAAERSSSDRTASTTASDRDLRRIVAAAVRDALQKSDAEAGRGPLSIAAQVPLDALLGRSAAVTDGWDRLQMELPFLVASLLSSSVATDDGGASDVARGSISSARDPVTVEEALGTLRSAAERGESLRAWREIVALAERLEERAAEAVELERVRVLLLWAWLLAEHLEQSDAGAAKHVVRSLYALGRVARKAARLDEAEACYRAALERGEEAGEWEVVARAHAGLGNIYFQRGSFSEARAQYVQLLEAALRVGAPRLLFRAYLDLAAYYHEGAHDYAKAAEYAHSGLDVARRENDREHTGRFLNELGLNELELGNHAAARAYFEEASAVGRETGSALLGAVSRINLGDLHVRLERYDDAIALLREGRSEARRGGLSWAECQADILIARALDGRGQTAAALDRLQQVEDRCVEHGLHHERELARNLAREIQSGLIGQLQALSS